MKKRHFLPDELKFTDPGTATEEGKACSIGGGTTTEE